MVQIVRDAIDSPVELTSDSRTEMARFSRLVSQTGSLCSHCWREMLSHIRGGPLCTSRTSWLPEKLGFDISRVDPLQGFQRLISITNATRLGFGLLKIGLVAGILIRRLAAMGLHPRIRCGRHIHRRRLCLADND